VDGLRESLDRLRFEVAELRASRERLVRASDGERRELERQLHDGTQQQLVAVAVNLQHACRLIDDDPAGAKTLLEATRRDVRKALDETRRLAHRIFPPLEEPKDLRVALRAAAASAGVSTEVAIAQDAACAPEQAATVYFCAVAVFEQLGRGASATVRVALEDGEVAFEITGVGTAVAEQDLAPVQERVEALGGRLEVARDPGGGVRVRGRLRNPSRANCPPPGTGSRP